MLFVKRLPDGTIERRRPAYKAIQYTITARELEMLRGIASAESYDSALNGHDGSLRSWHELERFERDGKTWVVLQSNGSEHLVEMELKPDGNTGEVNPLPPERAWKLALEQDKQRGGVISDP
jgi:hypothetical protein